MCKEEFLRKIIIFSGLNDEEVKSIAQRMQKRQVKKGDVIFREGESSNELYFIKKGRVNVLINPSIYKDAARKQIVTLYDGDIFGEFAFIDGAVRSATVIAEEDSELYYIRYVDFHRLLDSNEHMGYLVMRNLARHLTGRLRSMNLEIRNLLI